jgi:hypothetical protein
VFCHFLPMWITWSDNPPTVGVSWSPISQITCQGPQSHTLLALITATILDCSLLPHGGFCSTKNCSCSGWSVGSITILILKSGYLPWVKGSNTECSEFLRHAGDWTKALNKPNTHSTTELHPQPQGNKILPEQPTFASIRD